MSRSQTDTSHRIDPAAISVPGAAKAGKGGEGGDATATPFTASTPTNADFLAEIFGTVPKDATIAVASKEGDPQQGGWHPMAGEQVGKACPNNRNNYFNCASLNATDGGIAARKDRAAAYHALVLDDVGTKVDRKSLGKIEPTWELETSPGNFQIGFKISPPMTDAKAVEQLQQRIAAAGMTDKGALGMVRWARLPNGINGKPKYRSVDDKPFACKLHTWNPTRCYSAEAIGNLLAPVSTNTASKAVPSVKSPRQMKGRETSGGVFTPASEANPVLAAFKERGLYKKAIGDGRHEVTCPWVEEHTDSLDTGAAYFEPSDGYPIGGFCCQHSHKDKYRIRQVLDAMDLRESQARNRALIRLCPGEMPAIQDVSERLLAQRGDLYQAGGLIVGVSLDHKTGDARIVPIGDSALTLALSSVCDWEKFDGRSKSWVRCDPQPRHVGLLYKSDTYSHLPVLQGVARQPYFDPKTGKLVTKSGYDPDSQRLGTFNPDLFSFPEPTEQAAREALTLLQDLIGEFHFATDHDRAAALCAILTATVRPSLDLAPAFHVTAPSSGSGKSYLSEVISLFAGPAGSSRVSYPRTSEEATKVILSLLMSAPAVIEFDDMDTDWLPHGAINRMLTSSSMTDRVLGVSKVATVSTSTLVLGSGNNVGPLRDLARRVLTINLNAKSEAPGTLTYKGNPVAAIKVDRERYVSAALTIVAAWEAAGRPRASVPSIASYGGAWADHCRHPLIWLGLPDPAFALLEQMRSDVDADNLLRLLQEWHQKFGDKPMSVRRLLQDGHGTYVHDALLELPVVERGEINRSRLGHYFKRNRDRILALLWQKSDFWDSQGGIPVIHREPAFRRGWRWIRIGVANWTSGWHRL
ncbi:DNA-primase RepB domain-containing protein [Croceicoccus sp. Ery15]|uniref:DNA-primase RepB domain-containing protein n=1 Tax=Croceicoccus sp. Ery15 TaxID=1703338 RepID=UPI001E48E7A2|nr:DNA-primase RepB domain-containing protein [Croceicoccus sp. Ery15]